jgi:hypothetical protein
LLNIISGTPSSPRNVSVDKVSPTTADLVVVAPEENGGLPVDEYVVEYDQNVLTSRSGTYCVYLVQQTFYRNSLLKDRHKFSKILTGFS